MANNAKLSDEGVCPRFYALSDHEAFESEPENWENDLDGNSDEDDDD